MLILTDKTRFDWNNTGVHRACRHVYVDSDREKRLFSILVVTQQTLKNIRLDWASLRSVEEHIFIFSSLE